MDHPLTVLAPATQSISTNPSGGTVLDTVRRSSLLGEVGFRCDSGLDDLQYYISLIIISTYRWLRPLNIMIIAADRAKINTLLRQLNR